MNLLQRFISKQNLDELPKEDLVELYTKHIIPLPQRKYRPNRRGRDMTKKQVLATKKRRLDTASSSDQPPEK